jgi:hypothetical protein
VFNAVSSVGPSVVAGVPSLAGRDAVFALLARESLAGQAHTPRPDSPAPVVDRAWTLAGASHGQKSNAVTVTVNPMSGTGTRDAQAEDDDGAFGDPAPAPTAP